MKVISQPENIRQSRKRLAEYDAKHGIWNPDIRAYVKPKSAK